MCPLRGQARTRISLSLFPHRSLHEVPNVDGMYR
ncbi:unnamed protein product [Spirodela intermedia]|uniref:Uncharacterized protein n=1 Tax=Spirodela intermedia TaxID=51605 RepID=A0ABN7EBZ0_SPIIN|nr:unnamed protein product [Spirodela intermedia]